MTNNILFIELSKSVGQTWHPFLVNISHITAIEDVSTPQRTGCEIYTLDGRHTFVEHSPSYVLARILASNEGSPEDSGTAPPPLPESLGSGA